MIWYGMARYCVVRYVYGVTPFGVRYGTVGQQYFSRRQHQTARGDRTSSELAGALCGWTGGYGTVRYGTVRYGTVRYGTVRKPDHGRARYVWAENNRLAGLFNSRTIQYSGIPTFKTTP